MPAWLAAAAPALLSAGSSILGGVLSGKGQAAANAA